MATSKQRVGAGHNVKKAAAAAQRAMARLSKDARAALGKQAAKMTRRARSRRRPASREG